MADMRRAISVVLSAITLWPAHIVLGQIAELPALPAEAAVDSEVRDLIATRTRAVHDKPQDSPARYALALTFHANGLPDLAAQTYRQAIELDPVCARCWNNLAVIEANERSDLDAAIECADRAIAIDATYVPVRVRRGWWLLDLGREDEAMQAFESGLALDAGSVAAQIGIARVLLRKGDPAAALTRLEALAKTHQSVGGDPAFRLALGTAYGRLGRAEHARAVLAGVGSSPPKIADAWLDELRAHRAGYRARMTDAADLLGSGQTAASIATLEGVLRTKPSDADATVLLAQARMANGELPAARALLEELLKRETASYDAMLVLASLHLSTNDLTAALDLSQKAAAIDPGRSQAWALIGYLRALRGEHAAAAEAMTRAVQCGAQDPALLLARGRSLVNSGDYAAASRAFEQIVWSQPFLGAAYVGLARAVAEQGELPRATSLLERGKQLDPTDPLIAETAARIKALQEANR